MAAPVLRPLKIAIDDVNDSPQNAPISPVAAMEDLSLSPTLQHDDDIADYDLASASKLIPLSMTDSASGERPLPSLQLPLMFRDLPFVGLFGLHLILTVLATGNIRADDERKEERRDIVSGLRDTDKNLNLEDDADIGVALRSLCVVNVLFALGWLLLFIFYSKLRFVQGSCIFSVVGLTALSVMLFLVDSSFAMFWGIICAGVVVLDLVWYIRSNGLDFVAVFFELVVEVLTTHPALGYATIAVLVTYTVWSSWICTTIGYVGQDVPPWSLSMFYLIFHVYWMSNIFKNIITIVVSGTTMIWYCCNESTDSDNGFSQVDENEQAPQDPSTKNLDRKVVLHYVRCAISSSFGSICIGSLLCPIAHLLWTALRWARRDESALLRRFISLRSERVEHFIRTYHKFSFVHIAAYNKPYYVAAHDAWELIEQHGVEAIVDDDLTSRILLLGGNGWAGIMSALVASALAGASSHAIFFTLAAFTLCYTTMSLATQAIAAVIKTLFVCFAENPGRLSQLQPLIYHRFVRLAELKSFRDHKVPSTMRA
ncbi:ctl-like protein ddb_g0274487-like [Plasmopara halstedii]|uniref:Choline transporter-like protein n=1 Tax=Plasmopara halstedii TaxID=4781 RepID=A0A0P1ARV0_PLAHL|nr:ctl-like protein ddb_g0274487-like [Plasmopara halstedii]CEG44377.1 ctl-like protein ddb_g0274487-like [Plasmopara halstedii]|eukprot:XP_024580746.1 ctl-like protein ddb_g0274487-like [Plasmopara halstedii]